MSKFLYIQIDDGGSDSFEVAQESDFNSLYGWMSERCVDDDTELVKFFHNAEVGEVHTHRLGWCFRLKEGGDES